VGACDRGVRQVEEGGTEALRTSIRRIDGGGRSPDDQVRRSFHLSENVRRSERKAEGALRMHANGLHLGEKIKSEKTSNKHSKFTLKGTYTKNSKLSGNKTKFKGLQYVCFRFPSVGYNRLVSGYVYTLFSFGCKANNFDGVIVVSMV
jgi:hypothetical protein